MNVFNYNDSLRYLVEHLIARIRYYFVRNFRFSFIWWE